MAILTCLWTYTFWFGRITGGSKESLNPLTFGVVVIPIDIILMYPGPKALGINSDSNIYALLITLEIIHGFGFYLIQKEIIKYLDNT
jgi:hypothetical protein